MRRIAVVLRREAYGTARAAEGLRNAVGLSLADGNQVTAILLDDAAWLAAGGDPTGIGMPAAAKPISTLVELSQRVWVERESIQERGIPALAFPVAVKGRDELCAFLAACDAVVTW
ncbi:MAG: DsrE family protein [Planctomycetes bacterium]|nr:DsrE family protein [Planctomycetota bacterium]